MTLLGFKTVVVVDGIEVVVADATAIVVDVVEVDVVVVPDGGETVVEVVEVVEVDVLDVLDEATVVDVLDDEVEEDEEELDGAAEIVNEIVDAPADE